jgi:glycerophosphoryl diester phosphodiesterase
VRIRLAHRKGGTVRQLGGVVNVAHRGASAQVPENTLAAVRRAIGVDADLIELDVQRSKDGVLVLIHDTTLARTTNARTVVPGRAPWRVGDFTYPEILRLDAGSWKSPQFAGETIPTLTDAIQVIRQTRAGLLLELKHPQRYPGMVSEVVTTIRAATGFLESAVAGHRLVVQSFDGAALRRLTAIEPTVPVGLIGRPAPAHLPELARWADQINPHHYSVTASYVADCTGWACTAWCGQSTGPRR